MITTNKKAGAPLVDQPLSLPQEGEIIDGEILEIGKRGIFVDLPGFGTGTILGREIKANPQLVKTLKVGDKVSAVVLESENENGLVELSFSEAREEKSWQTLHEKRRNEEEIKVRVAQANRGGLIVDFGGIKGFLPVSQLREDKYPKVDDGDKNKILLALNKIVGQEITVRVMEANQREQKFIVSEKAKSKDEVAKMLTSYQIGQVVEGEITGLVDFGAFVKFGNPPLEGLIHISEIDWQIIEHPSKVLKVGQKAEAKIIDIQKNGQVALSLKALKTDPWLEIEKNFKKGDEIDGEAVKFNPFGAFVKITPEVQGLVHISEFGTQKKMKETLTLNKIYKFKILILDPKEHRLSLTLAQ